MPPDARQLRAWERLWSEDQVATPYQHPAFFAVEAQYSRVHAFVLENRDIDAILPMAKVDIGYGQRRCELAPQGQYGGGLGPRAGARREILTAGAPFLHGGVLNPREEWLRFRHYAIPYETSVVLRTPTGWPVIPPRKLRKPRQLGVSVIAVGPHEQSQEIYGLHVMESSRWGRAPLSRAHHDALRSLPFASTVIAADSEGRLLAYFLVFEAKQTLYSYLSATSPQARAWRVPSLLYAEVPRLIGQSCDRYDLQHSLGSDGVKAFKMSMGASHVSAIQINNVPITHRLRYWVAGQVNQIRQMRHRL